MGRMISSRLVGFRCELKSCIDAFEVHPALPARSTWIEQLPAIEQIVSHGWAVVLTPKLRAYCPRHADKVWDCTCKNHPDTTHLCVVHDTDTAHRVWDQGTLPEIVSSLDLKGTP